jgi:choline dehydrogenase-like flavoprotein
VTAAAPVHAATSEGPHPSGPAAPEVSRQALALARAILPDGRVLRGADERSVAAAARVLRHLSPHAPRGLEAIVGLLEHAALLRTGRRFSQLDADAQERLLRAWERDRWLRWPLFALAYLLKSVHFEEPAAYRALRCVYERGGPAEPARWLAQVIRGETLADAETLECDAVVVGTGAGGAVVGKELAARGHAVLFLEEGELWRRDSFDGRALEAHRRFYRNGGAVITLGNAPMPILMGRLVGGSTAVNSGTCFRTPPWILDGWCERLGSDDFAPARFDAHFDAVEAELGVATARAEYLGGAARVVARGCDSLGWRHFPLRRNAPDCDGQGLCNWGCPTDAKRSTNVSYVPRALGLGAQLVTGMRAERILLEAGRAVGVEARAVRGGARLRVRARAVVLAGGAVPTPLLLLGQGLCGTSGQLGRNLSLHPATCLSALFDENIEGYNAIPQGYGVDEFHREGILLLGASPALSVAALLFPMSGRRLMDAMDRIDRIASFGVMVEDEARGRVRRGPKGQPIVTYSLTATEIERLHRGLQRVAEIFLRAGARRIYPLLPRLPDLEPAEALRRLRGASLGASDFMLTSFHPLGTCRMGRDPKRSVVDLDHETHDVRGLFVVDGSVVPTAPAVNPQITIMAMAHRAAGRIDARLS